MTDRVFYRALLACLVAHHATSVDSAHADDHWAFRAPQSVTVPTAIDDPWCRNAIDAFVLKRHREQQIAPSPEAARSKLIRRLTLDLTGLPPTPAEIEDFEQDTSPRAYEKVVERLLTSHSYGERMALAWMDAARYGDTSALNADGVRDMWPWRDWVINAYNANKPFDEFLLEQLAGDLVENPAVDQLVATGFHRNSATSDENGAIAEELRVDYVVDRVKTTFNVFQGLSLECAQCHDHKYDPITQREYYGVFAFFNSAADPGLQTREGNQPPLAYLPDDSIANRLRELDLQLTRLDAQFSRVRASDDKLQPWLDEVRGSPIVGGQWYCLGDFTDGTLNHVFTPNQFAPTDQRPDLDASDGEFIWTPNTTWYDNQTHRTWMTRSSARYYYRTLTSPGDRNVTLSLDGGDAFRVWLNGVRLKHAREESREGRKSVDVVLNLRGGDNHLVIKLGAKKNGTLSIAFGFEQNIVPRSAIALLDKSRDSASESLRQIFQSQVWEQARVYRDDRNDLEAQRDAILLESPTSMVMSDRARARPTFLLERGVYDARGERVEPHLPAVFPKLPTGQPPNRLGLAHWMISENHPLTARVAVNRYWTMFMGRGLVRTPMDFGTEGSPPTHPALLDWMAIDFVRSGWDVKRMIKQIVMSSTYRQSSNLRSDLQDPENRWLGRANRLRLPGEFIRDQALAASGLLVARVGGPSIMPYQPEGLWKEVSDGNKLQYVHDTGSQLYRRGVYVYWKRSAPHPALTTFDTPNREVCQVVRMQTNTPLQALVLLNDETYVEAARHLAARMLHASDEFSEQVQHGFQLCASRSADARELAILRDVYQQQLRSFREQPSRAQAFLAHGDSPQDRSFDPAQQAACTVIAQVLLNLDEVIHRE